MIIKWLRARKERKIAEEAQTERQLEDTKAKSIEDNEKLTVEMEARPCAINGFNSCSRECIHFNEGWVRIGPNFFDTGRCVLSTPPSCKLWNS